MMHRRWSILRDGLFLAGASFMLLGCIASSFRSGKSLQPGQVSLSTGYMHGHNVDHLRR